MLDLSADRGHKSLSGAVRPTGRCSSELLQAKQLQLQIGGQPRTQTPTQVWAPKQAGSCMQAEAAVHILGGCGGRGFGCLTGLCPSPAAPLGVHSAALGLHILCDGLQQALGGGPVEHAQH